MPQQRLAHQCCNGGSNIPLPRENSLAEHSLAFEHDEVRVHCGCFNWLIIVSFDWGAIFFLQGLELGTGFVLPGFDVLDFCMTLGLSMAGQFLFGLNRLESSRPMVPHW